MILFKLLESRSCDAAYFLSLLESKGEDYLIFSKSLISKSVLSQSMFPESLFFKVYFCKMYSNCVSSKLCEFISLDYNKISSLVDQLFWSRPECLSGSKQTFLENSNLGSLKGGKMVSPPPPGFGRD